MSRKKKKQENSLSAYNYSKSKYLADVMEFSDSDNQETNEKIKKHLLKMIDLIDAMKINSNSEKIIDTALKKIVH
ncbi:MAG: hypothetical protein ACRBFS_18075 [Aureispira sp.]